MIVFSAKCVSGKGNVPKNQKILCGCLVIGSIFCGMVEQGQNCQNHEWFERFECELSDSIKGDIDYV